MSESEEKPSFIEEMKKDYIVRPSFLKTVGYINILAIYVVILILVSGIEVSYWYLLLYPVAIFVVRHIRRSHHNQQLIVTQHRIPFFTDSLANALSVGGTLQQAFSQSVYYLRGDFKEDFEDVMLKSSLGKDIGKLLRNLDKKYPKTGLRYLISLLEEYRDLGVGISPLLKKIAHALKIKEGEQEKIRAILAGGSGYAKLTVIVFLLSFLVFGLLMQDQIEMLLSPTLRPIFLGFVSWSALGLIIVVRITSIEFSNHYALRPYVKSFMGKIQWTINKLLVYSGLDRHLPLSIWRRIFLFIPLIFGVIAAVVSTLYTREVIFILLAYVIGILITRFALEFILKGLVEDQLIQVVEVFPDFLQVFIIGLNSGLNNYNALEFAEGALEGMAPDLLKREISRTKQSILYGDDPANAWQRLANDLPFESVNDFCEIMVVSPLHGESINKSIEQMMTTYDSKKLTLIEKKATALGQYVIPLIVVAFFPLFLFAVFGPLFLRMSHLFNM
jgi:Flp pilus assembly protein TadB